MTERVKREKATIMVVEDDPTTEQSLIDCLSDLGNVVTFSNAENALNFVARGGRVDLVISDIVLGQMNGIELCERLSQLFNGDQLLPVIFYSSFADPSMERLAYQAGGLDFIEKPMSFSRLQVRVRSFLEITRRINALRLQLSLDPLTGLMQRKALLERGSIELIKRLFSGATASMMLINCKNLSQINAQQGFVKGDLVLENMAQNLLYVAEQSNGVELLLGRHLSDQLIVFAASMSSDGVQADCYEVFNAVQARFKSSQIDDLKIELYAGAVSIVYDDALRMDRSAASDLLSEMVEAAQVQMRKARDSASGFEYAEFSYNKD
jgi:PleD family two-component response regulator